MNRNYRFNILTTLLLGFALLLSVEAYAQGRNSPESESDRYNSSSRVSHPSVGKRVTVLPNTRQTVRIGPESYQYSNGSFYRRSSNNQNSYVVISAPLNARVNQLPRGAVSFAIGSRRYFYTNFTYYLWDSNRRDYVVVAEPEGAEVEVASASESTGELFVYPAQGQTEEQRDRDMYECYLWASEQTGFDPSAGSSDVTLASNYRRANSACLEGRGYTVN